MQYNWTIECNTSTSMFVYMLIYYICMCLMYIYIFTHTHTHTHTQHTRTHTHTHTHTYIHFFSNIFHITDYFSYCNMKHNLSFLRYINNSPAKMMQSMQNKQRPELKSPPKRFFIDIFPCCNITYQLEW